MVELVVGGTYVGPRSQVYHHPILSPICSALPCHTRRMGNVFQIVAVSLRDIWSEWLCFVSVSMLAAVSDGCCVLPFYKHHGHFVIWVVQFV